MTTSITRVGAFIAAAALFAAGCGGSTNSSSSTSSDTSPTAAATTASQMSGPAMSAAAPVPSDLHCTDAIVWVNLTSKAYHMKGDEFYGRTKHGAYMCQATADGKGYHLAGTPHHHTGSQMSPAPSST